ncbi:MAG TPA: VCBS repeat-containing protein [Nannocystaceae bacterium]|nr:VCBS repeat-containing protein [Nannocystaceae bacterium]
MGGFLAGDAVRPLGDVNGDGLDDLGLRDYVVFSELEIAPLLYDETLLSQRGFRVSWASQDAAPEPRAAGDVNGDGLADLLVLHEPMGRAWIIFGKADLTPVDLSEVESGIGGFVVTEVGGVASVPPLGDVDGDGLGDLAFSTSSLEETRVIRGKADGDLVALGSDALLTVPGVARIAAGDFDGDGVVDLALCGPTLEILSAPGGWQSPMLHTTALGYTCGLGGLFQGGDFDVDGHDDLAFDAIVDAVATAILFGPVVTEGEPPGEADLSTYFVSTYGAALADLDGDGDSEVIVARDDDDGSSIWTWKIEDQKTPTECMPPQDRLYGPGKAAWVDVVGDLDGDGRDDLFESHSSVVITRVCSEVK